MPSNQTVHRIVAPDLMKYPPRIETSQPDQWSTIGDLHGNPLKLLYFMIAMGAVKMDPKDYEAYAQLYIQYQPAEEYTDTDNNASYVENSTYTQMEALLDKMTVVKDARIRELGDDFCDRGRDDTAMFSIMDRFKTGGGIFESITSNHGELFIQKMEYALQKSTVNGIVDYEKFIKAFIDNSLMPDLEEYYVYYRSITGLQYALAAGIISPEKLISQYVRYLETLKVLTYDYLEETDGEPVIYCHAGISKYNILNVLILLQGELTNDEHTSAQTLLSRLVEQMTDNDMLAPINAINRILQMHAKDHTITSLLTKNNKHTYLSVVLLNDRENPNDATICNNHGHTPFTFDKRISLDSLCGHENVEGDGFMTYHPDYSCDLIYTKSYATPEAAKKAKQTRAMEAQKIDNLPPQPTVRFTRTTAGSILGKRQAASIPPAATPQPSSRIQVVKHKRP